MIQAISPIDQLREMENRYERLLFEMAATRQQIRATRRAIRELRKPRPLCRCAAGTGVCGDCGGDMVEF